MRKQYNDGKNVWEELQEFGGKCERDRHERWIEVRVPG